MSQRANPLAIGVFFAAAITLLVAALFFFGAGDVFRKNERFVVFFEGSITGLKVGAPVTFQGVQIGQVTDIRLSMSADNETIVIPVLIDIDRDKFADFANDTNGIRGRMLERGLRAQLKIQSVLTSLLLVELDFYPGSPMRLRGLDSHYPELPTVPTPLQELLRDMDQLNLSELIHTTRETLVGIEKLVNHPDTQGSITALHQLLVHADEAIVRLDKEAVPAIQQLRQTLAEVSKVSTDVHQTYPRIADELEKALREMRQSVARFDQVMAEAQFLLSDDSALYQELQQAAQDVSRASNSVKAMSDTINDQPQSLMFGKPDLPTEK
jgi:paraquat-inducible protein B